MRAKFDTYEEAMDYRSKYTTSSNWIVETQYPDGDVYFHLRLGKYIDLNNEATTLRVIRPGYINNTKDPDR